MYILRIRMEIQEIREAERKAEKQLGTSDYYVSSVKRQSLDIRWHDFLKIKGKFGFIHV